MKCFLSCDSNEHAINCSAFSPTRNFSPWRNKTVITFINRIIPRPLTVAYQQHLLIHKSIPRADHGINPKQTSTTQLSIPFVHQTLSNSQVGEDKNLLPRIPYYSRPPFHSTPSRHHVTASSSTPHMPQAHNQPAEVDRFVPCQGKLFIYPFRAQHSTHLFLAQLFFRLLAEWE